MEGGIEEVVGDNYVLCFDLVLFVLRSEVYENVSGLIFKICVFFFMGFSVRIRFNFNFGLRELN